MSKTAYIGVNNVARKVKSNYIGVNGVARKVKKAYIGDANGKARLWWQSGGVIRGVWKTATVNNGRLEETRWQAIAGSDNGFALLGQSGTASADKNATYSTDGINWGYASAYRNGPDWADMAYGNGKYVACYSSTGNYMVYSTNGGASWSQSDYISERDRWHGTIFDGNKFVCIGKKSHLATSIDGITWTVIEAYDYANLLSVAYGNGYYVFTQQDFDGIIYSKDLNHFSMKELEASPIGDWKKIVYGEGKFFLIDSGNSETGVKIVCVDENFNLVGTTEIPLNDLANDIVIGAGCIVAGGYSNSAWASIDNWTQWHTLNYPRNGNCVLAFGCNKFVCASYGDDGVFYLEP